MQVLSVLAMNIVFVLLARVSFLDLPAETTLALVYPLESSCPHLKTMVIRT